MELDYILKLDIFQKRMEKNPKTFVLKKNADFAHEVVGSLITPNAEIKYSNGKDQAVDVDLNID